MQNFPRLYELGKDYVQSDLIDNVNQCDNDIIIAAERYEKLNEKQREIVDFDKT